MQNMHGCIAKIEQLAKTTAALVRPDSSQEVAQVLWLAFDTSSYIQGVIVGVTGVRCCYLVSNAQHRLGRLQRSVLRESWLLFSDRAFQTNRRAMPMLQSFN
jgi:hypothetical protein